MSDSNNNLVGLNSPDFTQIKETPKNSKYKKALFFGLKILIVLIILAIIGLGVLGLVYYNNIKQAYNLSLSAKDDLEQSLHVIINRDFKSGAKLINTAHGKLADARGLLDKVKIIKNLPYFEIQFKAVDELLIAGINLTDSGEKVVLLIEDITAPLKNESITYENLSAQQKRQILEKIVASEDMLYELQDRIDEADKAIAEIPSDKLVGPLREKFEPIRDNLPKAKMMIDNALPLLRIIPKIAGFDETKSYLFLLQNNSELRPTGGFIGTYGILKLKDGDLISFDTDNIYNLDRSTQAILKEPTPWQIAKYLEQKDWSMRDINWAPDFPTTALKSLEMYDKENKLIIELKKQGKKIIGEKGVEIKDVLPYEENLSGVIAMTPEILGGLLKITGPVVAGNMVFTDSNYQEQLELMVGKLYQELDIPISQRKGIIKELADQIKVKLMTVPMSQVPDLLDVAFEFMNQKQILIYVKDPEIQKMVLARGWAGDVKQTEGDYLFVVDSNMAALKTDQFVKRTIKYSLAQRNGDLIAKAEIVYQNNADFTWKSTRLRTYTRVYVPSGSELVSSSGAMENDKIKDPLGQAGQVEAGSEFNKAFFGAFISIEPHETGTLTFEYKLPARIKEQIRANTYNLLVQKQPGVLPDLTLDLKFGKNIKSAVPAEPENEWFNTNYNNEIVLDGDKVFEVKF
ncbi:MAG: DUF4012 domain-containing protein [Candidatus Parcubacteria bacterium]|nr:DUF4012 domain-containing protein [Candidatus Parcubacteria bacterium]